MPMSFYPETLNSLTPNQVSAFKERTIQNQRLSLLKGGSQDGIIQLSGAFKGWADQPDESEFLFQEFKSEGVAVGPVIAEGDSWFDYSPGIDIIDQLRALGYVFDRSYAAAGDTLENMIFGAQYDKATYQRLSPSIVKILKRLEKVKHRVFFFSGGGNDIAGNEFGQFLNHKDSGLPPFRKAYAEEVIKEVFRNYLINLTNKIYSVSPETFIVMHGYGYTVPTGKAVINAGPLRFIGPWLRPALVQKGIIESAEQRDIVFSIIDMYNETLESIAEEKSNFQYVDLRSVINPESDWVNELHLNNSAYYKVAHKIHDTVMNII